MAYAQDREAEALSEGQEERLSERSEFDLADTETTNFWQRSRHSLDFSLILDFAHVQQIENKFSFVFTQSQNCLSFLLVKQKKWKSKNIRL